MIPSLTKGEIDAFIMPEPINAVAAMKGAQQLIFLTMYSPPPTPILARGAGVTGGPACSAPWRSFPAASLARAGRMSASCPRPALFVYNPRGERHSMTRISVFIPVRRRKGRAP